MRRCREAASLAPEEAALTEERYEFADIGMREVRHAPMVEPPALTRAQPLPWPQPLIPTRTLAIILAITPAPTLRVRLTRCATL